MFHDFKPDDIKSPKVMTELLYDAGRINNFNIDLHITMMK